MLPKLHLITWKTDSLRPAMSCVQITRKDLRASDSICLAIIPTENTALAKCDLPEDPIYLHFERYKLLTAPTIIAIRYDADKRQFVAYHKGSKPETIVPLTDMDERYPDFEPLLTDWNDAKPTKFVGVNHKILLNLGVAIAPNGDKNVNVALAFDGYKILVKSNDPELKAQALIMAAHLENADQL
jgi:hypothetical protein